MEDAEIFSLFLVGRQDEEVTDLKPYGWINQREKKSNNGFPELAILHGKVNYNQKSNKMGRVMVEKRKRKMTLATEQIVIKISQNLLLPRMHYSLSSISRQFIISYLEYSPNLNWWRGDVEKDLGKGLHRGDWGKDNGNMWWNLRCCSRKSNLCFSMVNVSCLAVIWFLIAVLSFASIVSESASLSSPAIETFNFRISSSRIFSGVVIASQFSPIYQSPKFLKSGFQSEGNKIA